MDSRHLILLGPAFLVTLMLWPAEVFPTAAFPDSAKAAVANASAQDAATTNTTDPVPPEYRKKYSEGRREGFQQGLRDAVEFNCKKPVAWRPHAYYERQKDPWEFKAGYLGHSAGHDEAYEKVCGHPH